ncbi:hypothetical protein ACLOJK_019806 [Asimina triloba]
MKSPPTRRTLDLDPLVARGRPSTAEFGLLSSASRTLPETEEKTGWGKDGFLFKRCSLDLPPLTAGSGLLSSASCCRRLLASRRGRICHGRRVSPPPYSPAPLLRGPSFAAIVHGWRRHCHRSSRRPPSLQLAVVKVGLGPETKKMGFRFGDASSSGSRLPVAASFVRLVAGRHWLPVTVAQLTSVCRL